MAPSETNCIFCKIIAGDMPTEFLYEDDQAVVFRDIHPKADVHLLLVPRIHIPSLESLESQHRDLVSHMVLLLPDLAHRQGLQAGFRTIVNTGRGGGQEIDHLHFHLLGGGSLSAFN